MNLRLLACCSAFALAIAPAAAQNYGPDGPPPPAPDMPAQPPANPAPPPAASEPPSNPTLQPPAAADTPRTPQYNAPADLRRLETRTMPAPDSPGGVAPDRTDLGRDCANAQSRVDQTICKNADLRALDNDIARLTGTMRGDPSQQAWVNSLAACETASNTVYDGPIYNCLRARYEARVVQLARQAGGPASGQYRLIGGAIAGNLTLIEWPQEQRVTAIFNKITTDGARACGIRLDVPAQGGVIQGSPQGLPGCSVSIALGRGTANVQSNNCASLCEMGERVDGTYVALGAIAPAAAPRRATPSPTSRPTPPRNTAPYKY